MIPEASRVRQAFDQFDELRGLELWRNWEAEDGSSFTVVHDGKRYPLQWIWSRATGRHASALSGDLRGAHKALRELGFQVVARGARSAAARPFTVWWVNQGQSHRSALADGFLEAPKTTEQGIEHAPYKRLEEVRAGDVLIHYWDQAIQAIGRAKADAVELPASGRGKRLKRAGWRVEVEYFELGKRAVPRRRFARLFKKLEIDEGPFQAGKAIRNGYLWRFSAEGLRRLQDAVKEPWPAWAVAPAEPSAPDASAAPAELAAPAAPAAPAESPAPAADAAPPFELGAAVRQLIDAVAGAGFVFEPWQIAAFVTALRTKPFVILAGVSGTGKSRLPRLVARATGCTAAVVPVRPDWTDSSDVLGYVDLQGTFRPGPVLHAAARAGRERDRFHLCIVDEMNLARVEHYLAEVLSRMEDRAGPAAGPEGAIEGAIDGTIDGASDGAPGGAPLVMLALGAADAAWGQVALPANLAIVGTVNMDESAHGFSRKVLDRAFTLELSDIDLQQWGATAAGELARRWPVTAWQSSPVSLARRAAGADRDEIARIVGVLVEVNAILAQAQLQVGYRTRDEVALFVLNAAEVAASFVTHADVDVDPLDLALLMKILPRVAGGSAPVRQVVLGLLGFATGGKSLDHDDQAEAVAVPWRAKGRRASVDNALFPRTAARLCLMWDRLIAEGFTSFWL